jgi:hypothetical protein
MGNLLWRVAIAAVCFVAFIYIVPLFLAVIEISVAGPLWALLKALAALAAVAFVVWGRATYPWTAP